MIVRNAHECTTFVQLGTNTYYYDTVINVYISLLVGFCFNYWVTDEAL